MHDALLENGVDTVFGYSGGANLPILDQFHDSKIRFVMNRSEQCCGHAAEGYARSSGRTGVILTTSGPGLTNIITPLQDARGDSTPLVALSGQVPTAAVGTDANNIMESLMSKVDGTNKNKLIKLSEGTFSMDKISELLKIMSDATPAANALATNEIIKLKPDLDRGTVEDTVAGVDTSVSGNLAPEPRSKAMGTSSLPNFEIGTSAASWEDQNTVVDTPETSREKRAEAVFNPKKESFIFSLPFHLERYNESIV